ncbi:lipid acyl hydrolase [Niveomyces insectorum RCEF 264]|uniref:Lipid acyl hydrolase n=1 Tax=Niveomyces insectorum RCEF 264 TaxID=1081102 RepID=A0A167LNQ5_9HYPO|nr:lipid acyl hydrolase [Niveomyces insectorum RCEF 264]
MSDFENEPNTSPQATSPPSRSLATSGNGDHSKGDNISNISSGDDLFGDGGSVDDSIDGGDEQMSDRPLSEHGLESDIDDEDAGRRYSYSHGDGVREATKEEFVMDTDLFRHRVPKPVDGTLQSLRIPAFILINPEAYDADAYEPTALELENSITKNSRSVARYRKEPTTGALQSNAAIYRWNDGSVTLAIGDEHFEVLTKSLAPPASKSYQELQDAHYYAAAAHLSSSLLLTVGHVTEQYSVRANRTVEDDALQRLADRLQAASQTVAQQSANMIIRTLRDPELAKREAELAEKERERARRRRETAAARLDGVVGAGRVGSGGWGAGGTLSINDLEGGSGGGASRRGGAGRKRGLPSAPRTKRRRPDYDSDDELPQGLRRNDEYDRADDFIAPSDDELSDEEDENDDEADDEEEEILEDEDEEANKRATARLVKRRKTAEATDQTDDADSDGPTRSRAGAAADGGRRNRRHVINDDDDDYE